jgi:large subunit ribosomal protein L24
VAARIRKGDKVVVITGKDKGKTGEVISVSPTDNRAVVRGIHMIRRHQRQSAREQGGIIVKEGSIHLSNLAIADPSDGKPTRVGFRVEKDGSKVRVAKRSGDLIDG